VPSRRAEFDSSDRAHAAIGPDFPTRNIRQGSDMKLNLKNMNTLAACTLVAAAAWSPAFDAAGFTGYYTTSQVFCDMANIKGNFLVSESRYVSSGTCVNLQANQQPQDEMPPGTSQFDQYNKSKELFRVGWTAEAGYNPASKETWETITLPPPRIDEKAPPGRPYGRFTWKMVCSSDPWLESGSAHCAVTSVTATGDLGEMEKMLRQYAQPFSVPRKEPQSQTLRDAHASFVKRAQLFSEKATQAPTAPKLDTLPEIMEPRVGVTYPPQTPLKIRVRPPSYVKVQTYLLQMEVKQNNGEWKVQTNIPVNAAELEGVLGYKGWGWHQPGTGQQMTATAGTYRVRAQATFPDRGEAGEWHEFIIAGEPGAAPDKLQTGKVVTRAGLGNASTGSGAAAATMGSALAKSGPETAKEGTLQTPQVLVPQKGALDWSKASAGASALQALPRSQP